MNTIDIGYQIGALGRTVRNEEKDGRPLRTVVVERTYRGELADVWDALTTIERIPRWLAPISGDLRLGGRYQIEGNAGGEIIECEAPRRLRVTWEYNGDVSWVEGRLSEVPGGVHLIVEHSAHLNPEWEAMGFGPGAVGIGWDLMLLGLALHLEADGDLAHPTVDPAAWAQTPEAKQFMRLSGQGWGDADEASGTPAEVAEAAAATTIKAYTGS
jgi:uncharacterized protein YndB with AHSA1/START domain